MILEDNQPAIDMAKKKIHGQAKHIEIKYHFIREQVDTCTVDLKYYATEDMIADMFTKGLSRDKLMKMPKWLN